MDSLFATILDDGHNVVGADKCSLFFVDEENGELWTKVATDNQGEIKVRVKSNFRYCTEPCIYSLQSGSDSQHL